MWEGGIMKRHDPVEFWLQYEAQIDNQSYSHGSRSRRSRTQNNPLAQVKAATSVLIAVRVNTASGPGGLAQVDAATSVPLPIQELRLATARPVSVPVCPVPVPALRLATTRLVRGLAGISPAFNRALRPPARSSARPLAWPPEWFQRRSRPPAQSSARPLARVIDRVPEAAIQLDGLTVFRADRNAALCGKTRGGGMCVYINTEWCKNSVLVSRFCSLLVELVTVRCRPFYIPREFTTVFIVGVYIPPSANAKEVLCKLYGAISDLQNAHPDRLFFIAGDFNHANLRTVLSKLHQYVDFATRGGNTLDLVYTNIPGAYRAEPRPHLGYSDHISVMLIPAYRQLIRRSKPVLKQVKTWPAGATSALQDCFECTDWDMFREAATNGDSINLEEYTSTVTSYISKCVDDVTISKTITTRSNRKPWINANVCALLKKKRRCLQNRGQEGLKNSKGQTILCH
ncbi:hypothetical protein Q8A73_017213 [Channa argus]|nr:hypothetical protein Q8A73_017213 [Channa argus]